VTSLAISRDKNKELLLEVFRAIEERNDQKFSELLHSDFEIHWPASLPYGEGKPQSAEADSKCRSKSSLKSGEWIRVVVVANEDEVVVLWRQRGSSPVGERFDGEVLGLYRVQEGKLARAQMFYFDAVAVANFLDKAMEQLQR
jgi:ketosteroid isomerase-like protein